jgi:ubiquitin-protein ligase
MEVFRIVE